jgi:hypothetical protein
VNRLVRFLRAWWATKPWPGGADVFDVPKVDPAPLAEITGSRGPFVPTEPLPPPAESPRPCEPTLDLLERGRPS